MIGELSPAQIETLLHAEVVGRLGLHVNGRTYVVPITFAYDGRAIHGHTHDGLKLRMLRENPRVCFEVDRVHDLANWESVIAWGTFEELHDSDAAASLQHLLARVSTLPPTRRGAPPHHAPDRGHVLPRPGTAVFRIVLGERSGRFERSD